MVPKDMVMEAPEAALEEEHADVVAVATVVQLVQFRHEVLCREGPQPFRYHYTNPKAVYSSGSYKHSQTARQTAVWSA